MRRTLFNGLFVFISLCSFSQKSTIDTFLSDSSLIHASVSICISDADNGAIIKEYNSGISLIPASVMKLITSAAALEILGPDYTFKTTVGYSGSINKRSGKLTGNIVIRGGGDPALGSKYFSGHYQDFLSSWITEIKKLGINKVEGRIISDDSYYDYLAVPAKWLWEDTGNYYGAGVYGLSVFDNTYEIHFKTSADSTLPVIREIIPKECKYDLKNWLIANGTTDKGNVFAAPYSKNGWMAGSIPSDKEDFILKASITDPPLLLAKIFNDKLVKSGITISEEPTTTRLKQNCISEPIVTITEIQSPPLSDIIKVLNHESINLYAETLVKELGKKYKNEGSTSAGVDVVFDFLHNAGIKTDGLFIQDGSGLSPLNAICTRDLVSLLIYMKRTGKYFKEYYASLPYAGKEGTLKGWFMDPAFDSNLKAKSGSMARVRNYAGYFSTASGKNIVFSIIVNNYTGPSKNIISGIENILKEITLTK
jgi:serine-type D-Ala-D-Ala carboxypeptidase/endopeptidase (penicillin-binding protein 4)